jgi:hypothetical protein
MTPENMDRTIFDPLRALAAPAPDPARAARVRARCCSELSRHRARAERLAQMTSVSRQVVASLVVALLCAACLADMISIAIRTLTV